MLLGIFALRILISECMGQSIAEHNRFRTSVSQDDRIQN